MARTWTGRAGTLALALGATLAGSGGAGAQTGDPPLFASHEPLALTLVADLANLRSDRRETERAARLVLPTGDTLEVEVRPRGNLRRNPAVCSFPPLRLDVPAKRSQGTVFQGQDKLKMVVPCHLDRDDFEPLVLREYLLYRAYGLLTPLSLRVRLARISFVDSGGRDEPRVRWAYFIENDEAFAARVGGTAVEVPEGKSVRADLLHPESSTLTALFQYLIGNTDWNDLQGHNVAILAVPGRVVPVPFDFDFSGAVEAPYANPDDELPIANVRQRLYRGWCRPDLDPAPLLERLREIRPSLEELYRTFEPLDERTRSTTLDYFADFYENVATPERAAFRVFRDCRRLP